MTIIMATCCLRSLLRKGLLCCLCLGAALVTRADQPTPIDADPIKATALDYIEGWYAGDAARMEQALHPELAKRQASFDSASGRTRVQNMSAMSLVQATRAGSGRQTPAAGQRKDVQILDMFQHMALVRTDMRGWVDYMQLAKSGDRWLIVNVLWELREPAVQK
jgi:hypothetical protein